MRAVTLSQMKSGINRLRTKGGASPSSLYELTNGYVTQSQTLQVRPGCALDATALNRTDGLFGYMGKLQVFAPQMEVVPPNYNCNVVRFPYDPTGLGAISLRKIHYVAPVLGKLYVVAEFFSSFFSRTHIVHFWLRDPGEWESLKVYPIDSVVRPTFDAGYEYAIVGATPAPPAAWAVSGNGIAYYDLGDVVQPTTANGMRYTVTDQTFLGQQIPFSTEPEWNSAEGSVTVQRETGAIWKAGETKGTAERVFPNSQPKWLYFVSVPGTTGTTEPVWPTVTYATVVDGTVTWTAFPNLYLEWTAAAIYKSGVVEPVWPSAYNATVTDGTITWQVRYKDVRDPNCPHDKATIVAAGKVFSNSNDITRYSATNNPLDWTTADDAGFLPTGQQAQGSQIGTGLGSYRGNLVWWSSSTAQIWNVDPDPAEMSLFDVLESAGMLYSKAHAAVDNDLYWLSPLGVRSISVAVGSTNLQAGDLGSGIDELITAAIAAGGVDIDPLGFYFPAQGQFWLALGAESTTTVFVYTRSVDGKVGAWSRYILPFKVEAAAQLNGELYLRDITNVYRFDKALDADAGVPIASEVRWPYLDFANLGVTKHLIGIDVVGTGAPTLQFGWDQNDFNVLTDPYPIDPDTLTGQLIPFPLSAPSISTRLTYSGAWSLNAATLYLADRRLGS